MDYMILDSTGNALGAYEDEIEAHAALRQIAATEPGVADVALLTYVDGMSVGEAVTPDDLPAATYSVALSQWTTDLGKAVSAGLPRWRESLWFPFGARAEPTTAVGVAAAPDWEDRLMGVAQ